MNRRSSGSSEGSTASIETSPAGPNDQQTKKPGHSRGSEQASHNTRPSEQHERQRNPSSKSSSARIRRPSSNINWKPTHSRNGSAGKEVAVDLRTPPLLATGPPENDVGVENDKMAVRKIVDRRLWSRSPWAATFLTILATIAGIALLSMIVSSSGNRQMDAKGCRMSYMDPRYIHLSDFDTEHTRFASKYSLYLYREGGVFEDPTVRAGTCRVGPDRKYRTWLILCLGFGYSGPLYSRKRRELQASAAHRG